MAAPRQDLRLKLLRHFRRLCKCPEGEARYYLESAGFDMAAALAARNADTAWEQEQALAAQARLEAEAREHKAQQQQAAATGAAPAPGEPWWARFALCFKAAGCVPQPAPAGLS